MLDVVSLLLLDVVPQSGGLPLLSGLLYLEVSSEVVEVVSSSWSVSSRGAQIVLTIWAISSSSIVFSILASSVVSSGWLDSAGSTISSGPWSTVSLVVLYFRHAPLHLVCVHTEVLREVSVDFLGLPDAGLVCWEEVEQSSGLGDPLVVFFGNSYGTTRAQIVPGAPAGLLDPGLGSFLGHPSGLPLVLSLPPLSLGFVLNRPTKFCCLVFRCPEACSLPRLPLTLVAPFFRRYLVC